MPIVYVGSSRDGMEADVIELYAGWALVGALVLGLGLASRSIRERLWLSEPLLALLVGVVVGPSVLGWLNPEQWAPRDELLAEAARLTLGVGLMAVALRLPGRYVWRHWRPISVLLAVVMPLAWAIVALLLHWLVGLSWTVAFVIAAVVTPTDPVVASAIVTGSAAHRRIPGRLRHLLSAEAGLNDGLGLLFVMLPTFLLHDTLADGVTRWLTGSLLHEVLGGATLGVILGFCAGKALCFSERSDDIERTSFLVQALALSLLGLGLARLLQVDGLLTVFISGVVFDRLVGGSARAQESGVQEAVSQFFTLPVFSLLGMVLPFGQWKELGWSALAAVAAVLLLRRLPGVLLLARWMRPLEGRADALFFGWFGPIGVSAILYAMLALEHGAPEVVWTLTSLVVTGSLVVHGVTSTPLSRSYARWTKRPRASHRPR